MNSSLSISHEFQAADTQEFGTKLHKIFYDTLQHQLLHHCSCDTEQVSVVIILSILGGISHIDVGTLDSGWMSTNASESMAGLQQRCLGPEKRHRTKCSAEAESMAGH